MATRFEHFGNTPFSRQLKAAIDTPDRYIEYRAFSREGLPALTALVSVLTPFLLPLKETDPLLFNAAKQFCGWYVGETMRQHGHVIVRKSASVPGKLFNVAAVWSGAPVLKADAA
jgi:hypothetical protein